MVASDDRPKVAIIGVTHPFRGGIAHHSTLLVKHLRKKYPVRFISLSRQYPALLFPGKTQLDDSAQPLREEHQPLIDSINPLSWIQAALALKQDGVDLVVIQWWNPFFGLAFGTLAHLLKLISNVRVCFLCHNVMPHESTLLDRVLSRYAFSAANHFIVHSQEDKANLLELRPGAIVRKNVHPTLSVFGELASHDKAEARAKLGIPTAQKVVLFFGLVRRYKGLKYLIEAVATVVKSLDCVLWIVGEFYEAKDEYLAQIKELGLEQRVVIRDEYVKNEAVPLYFAIADVVVLPYVSATQSGIVQIAYGLNKPVITTNVGGLPEAVEDGKTGFVVEPESPEKLADAILRFYAGNYEPVFSEEIRRRASNFSWDEEVSSIESFLRKQPE